LEFFAGQPEIVYLSVLALIIFGLVAFYRQYLSAAKILGLALIFFALFILPELLPFWQLVKLSSREIFNTWESQTFWSFHPRQLGELVSPWLSALAGQVSAPDRQEWLKNIFFGASGLFLAFYGLKGKKTRKLTAAV
jgi:hypothetical protein